MARVFIVIFLASVVFLGNETAFSQTAKDRGEKIFTPLKNIRERAANGVLKDAKVKVCEACKLNGKLCKQCACKRKQRAEKEAEEKAKEEKAKEAELKKLEADAKKAELEAKLLEEQDKERNKPWDIADDANLKSPSELLQLAAASKQHQDLAPKKQEALDYLAQLGCNKDPNVEKAILAGLKDYNAKVRLAAIQAVLDAVRGPMPEIMPQMVSQTSDPYQLTLGQAVSKTAAAQQAAQEADAKAAAAAAAAAAACPPKPDPCDKCQGRRHHRTVRKGLCRGCRGKGCNACNYCGEITEVYTEPCPYCVPQDGIPCSACSCEDGCRSCCPSKEIMAELQRIAHEPDSQRKNCMYEPSIDVRNLALEALRICPEVPEPQRGGNQGIPETGGGAAEKPKGIGEQGSVLENSNSDQPTAPEDPNKDEKKTEDEGGDSIQENGSTTQSGVDSPFKSVVYSDSNNRFLGARLSKFLPNDQYLVELEGDYLIPVGKRLFVENSAGSSQIVEVIGSEVGRVQVAPVEGRLVNQRDSHLSIGIIQ